MVILNEILNQCRGGPIWALASIFCVLKLDLFDHNDVPCGLKCMKNIPISIAEKIVLYIFRYLIINL